MTHGLNVIPMALRAGAAAFYPAAQQVKEQNYIVSKGFLERFAAEVAAAEREECAKVAEDVGLHEGDFLKHSDPRKTCAAAIRARGSA